MELQLGPFFELSAERGTPPEEDKRKHGRTAGCLQTEYVSKIAGIVLELVYCLTGRTVRLFVFLKTLRFWAAVFLFVFRVTVAVVVIYFQVGTARFANQVVFSNIVDAIARVAFCAFVQAGIEPVLCCGH